MYRTNYLRAIFYSKFCPSHIANNRMETFAGSFYNYVLIFLKDRRLSGL